MLDLRSDLYSTAKPTSALSVVEGMTSHEVAVEEFAELLGSSHVLTNDADPFSVGGRMRLLLWANKCGFTFDFLMGRHESQRGIGVERVPEEREAEILPMELVSKMPPSWGIHGDADTFVPVEDSRRFVKELRGAGVVVQYIEIPGAEHELIGLLAD